MHNYIYTYYPCNTGTKDSEAVSALNNVHQLNHISTINFFSDGASGDRADKCSISNHCYNVRRRFITLQAAITDETCKYICTYFLYSL